MENHWVELLCVLQKSTNGAENNRVISSINLVILALNLALNLVNKAAAKAMVVEVVFSIKIYIHYKSGNFVNEFIATK